MLRVRFFTDKVSQIKSDTADLNGMSLHLKFWGVRGSLPSCQSPKEWVNSVSHSIGDFFRSGYSHPDQIKEYIAKQSIENLGGFGTHTTVVEVNSNQQQIIIDGGSALANLGNQMMKGPAGQGKAEIHIFMTHFHWDHVLGIPFFPPHFVKGNVIHYYAVQPELEDIVRLKFRKPLFPVSYESLPCTIKFHQLEPRQTVKVGDIEVTPYQLDHPDPCWGFKVCHGGKTYAHCVDTEATRVTRESLGLDLPLYQGVDVMYFDAQYTLPELTDKSNWGHSAAQIGLDLAFREGIKRVVFAHHDPGATNQQIQELHRETLSYFLWRQNSASTNRIELPKVEWQYGYEGLELDLK